SLTCSVGASSSPHASHAADILVHATPALDFPPCPGRASRHAAARAGLDPASRTATSRLRTHRMAELERDLAFRLRLGRCRRALRLVQRRPARSAADSGPLLVG